MASPATGPNLPLHLPGGEGGRGGKDFPSKIMFWMENPGLFFRTYSFCPMFPPYRNPPPSFSVARFTYFTFLVPAHPCSRPPEVASGEGAEGRPRPDVASARTSFIIPSAPPLPRASWESQPPFQPFRAVFGGSQKSVAFQLFGLFGLFWKNQNLCPLRGGGQSVRGVSKSGPGCPKCGKGFQIRPRAPKV